MKLFFLFLIFTCYVPSFAQENIEVKIDKRIEAISIFYTLATRDTLDIKPTPSTYYKDFDTNFDKCKNHQSLNWYRYLESWDGFVNMLRIELNIKASQVFTQK